jgi:RNA polymerase sigma-70 factor, ECF subfamily
MGTTGPSSPTARPPAPEGDRRAFDALFEAYHARIYDYVARTLDDADAAADVTQDVFLRAYRTLPETAARGAFRPEAWLYRIATNRCIDVLRHRRLLAWRSLDRLLPWRAGRGAAALFESAAPYLPAAAVRPSAAGAGATAGEVADPAAWGDPPGLALRHERAADVRAALGRLRARHRTVLLLREVHQLSYDEIAEVLATSRPGVRSLLFRAREEFRRVWPRVSPDPEGADRR